MATNQAARSGSGPEEQRIPVFEESDDDGLFDAVPRFIKRLDGFHKLYAVVFEALIETAGAGYESPALRQDLAACAGVGLSTVSKAISWGKSSGVLAEVRDSGSGSKRQLLLLWRRTPRGVRRMTPDEALEAYRERHPERSHKRSCARPATGCARPATGCARPATGCARPAEARLAPHIEDRGRESRSLDNEIERTDPEPISTPTITIPEPEPPAPSEAREPVALVASLGVALRSARAPESRPAPGRAAPPPSPEPAPPPPRRRSRMDPDELLRMTERLASEGDPAALAELQRRGCAPPAPPPPDAPVPELVRALASGDPGVRDPTIPLAVNAIMAETGDSGELSYRTWLKVCGEVASRARPPESIIEPLENTFRRIAAGERIPNVPGYVMRGVKRWKPPDRVRASPCAVS